MKDNELELIKKYILTANRILIHLMYLKCYCKNNEISEDMLKNKNPGHLGSSLTINFIIGNLNYFFNKNKLTHQLVIGTGHSGASLIINKWLDATLEVKNKEYSRNIDGLNNLINSFGTKIRSEINPSYPDVIYDGGELGYSLGVAYGYAIDSPVDIVPCIIGDGEAEEGTLAASWQLNKILKTKSKVLPIINLNGYKMCSKSFLSRESNKDLLNYFSSFGYNTKIVDIRNSSNFKKCINNFQKALTASLNCEHPLIILKSYKGYTLPKVNNIEFENTIKSHKNPLVEYNSYNKIIILREFLKKYNVTIFNSNGKLINNFIEFYSTKINRNFYNIKSINISKIKKDNSSNILEKYLDEFFKKNNGLIFSPDEIYSNFIFSLSSKSIEILNENVLQALYQGYIQAGNQGFYIGYEGFMSMITSMISQYYKSLVQEELANRKNIKNSLNYILTSTCFENTYSHQNPNFVNELLGKNDKYFNILFPKDENNLLKCLQYISTTKNKINIITTSKRHTAIYQSVEEANIRIDIIHKSLKPNIILCATGDYMLDVIDNVYEDLKKLNIFADIIYITNPKIFDVKSINSLSEEEFNYFFNRNIPTLYLYSGYAYIIKSLLYERCNYIKVIGYEDEIKFFGSLNNNLKANNMSLSDIKNLCFEMLKLKN